MSTRRRTPPPLYVTKRIKSDQLYSARRDETNIDSKIWNRRRESRRRLGIEKPGVRTSDMERKDWEGLKRRRGRWSEGEGKKRRRGRWSEVEGKRKDMTLRESSVGWAARCVEDGHRTIQQLFLTLRCRSNDQIVNTIFCLQRSNLYLPIWNIFVLIQVGNE